ncbi:MAG: fructose-bisphosphate aldolase [archaeon]
MKLNKITTKGKALFLAYDQGLEHGPVDFNDKNVDPLYILEIAKKGKFNAIIFQKGIAEKYYKEIKKSKVPLILKLNGKTNLVRGEPISAQISTVEEAVKLGAAAVGFTVYIGSKHEEEMLEEFAKIEKEAHKKGFPVIAWIYPRGEGIKGRKSGELMAYACRVGLEIGADIIKVQYNGNKEQLKWAVKSAGRAKVLIAGGIKKGNEQLIKQAEEIMKAGASGMAIGRNVWQDKEPLKVAGELRKIILK